MRSVLMWDSVEWPGLEHLVVTEGPDGIEADGLVVALDQRPIRLHYRVRFDKHWTTRELAIEEHESSTTMRFLSDGAGRWTDADGRVLVEMAGCVDVDIAATPFTNTLPIRRLPFDVGESHDLRMLWVLVPEMTVRAADQRYTLLERRADGATYRYESGSFRVDLPVDERGFVLDYPGFWRRRWP
jgi:hypothetical protein